MKFEHLAILLIAFLLATLYFQKTDFSTEIKKYQEKNVVLEDRIDSLSKNNEGIRKTIRILSKENLENSKKVDSLSKELKQKRYETDKRVNTIDKYSDDDLNEFFTNRYNSLLK